MTNLDASNSVGGVTIDLHLMDHIEISDDRTRVNLGPGHVLRDAYSSLELYNLSMVGGRIADAGLPGFTIGGGLSNLSPQYGLALDNVWEYQLVLPNATIVNVSETAHPDLYFALRGGGNNFGIVTNFCVRLVPQGQMLGGQKTYHINYTDQLIDQSYKLATTLSTDTRMTFWSRYFYDVANERFRMSFFQAYSEPVLQPSVFEELNKITYESSNLRIDWEVEGVNNTPGFSSAVVVQALHINAIDAMKLRGGNALGIESDEPLMIALLTLGWSNGQDDEAMYCTPMLTGGSIDLRLRPRR